MTCDMTLNNDKIMNVYCIYRYKQCAWYNNEGTIESTEYHALKHGVSRRIL